MSMRLKRRPVIFMPHWDVRLAGFLTRRNYRCIGVGSTDPFDIALFVDGPPVTPIFYGEAKLGSLKCSMERDRSDVKAFRQLKASTPKLGIGRGAHLLNIMNGGSAWQHVDGHNGGPHVTTCLLTGKTVILSSLHSQLMLPNERADILTISKQAKHLFSDGIQLHRDVELKDALDVEACYYLDTNSLCFQPDVQHGHEGTLNYLETLMHSVLVLGRNDITCEP